jgi:UbiD family decarboxylase
MPFQSLRDYLEVLEKKGQLLHISEKVMPEPDVRKYLRAVSNMEKDGPALLFDNIVGYKGQRMAAGVCASWANHAVLLDMDAGATVSEQFRNVAEKWKKKETAAELKWVDNAPCQEVVIEDNINLYELLPLFRVNPNDGGFYLGKASVVTQDPDDPDNLDLENVGMYRIQLHGSDTIGMQIAPKSQGNIPLRKYDKKNEPMPIAVLLGPPPFVSSMACAGIPINQSEYKIASALMGEPLEMTKCLGSNINIPAWTEIVLEGESIPNERFVEGPFGEYPGSYSGVMKKVRFKITRVTHRRSPILENLYIGRTWTEHDTICGLFTSAPIYMELIEKFPEVKAVNANFNHGISVVVATDQRFNGFSKTVGLAIATTTHGLEYAKNIILVDGDIDPFNMNEVMWGLSFRLEHESDVIVIPKMRGSMLDPSTDPRGVGSKLILDATTPMAPESLGFAGIPPMVEPIEEVERYVKKITDLQTEQFEI